MALNEAAGLVSKLEMISYPIILGELSIENVYNHEILPSAL